MMRYLFMAACLLIGSDVLCQKVTSSVNEKQYFFVDSIALNSDSNCSVWIGFKHKEEGESVIKFKQSGKTLYYKDVLTCYSCQGKGVNDATYGGHFATNSIISFVQIYWDGVDTVAIDFSGAEPVYYKVIRRTNARGKNTDPDYTGNYLFMPRKQAPIIGFPTPLAPTDPKIRAYFDIKPLKWHAMRHK